ncbi:hypothetical protein WJX74_005482 [Apatococcus lobatus]|uniref:Uncharacterized protein n=1 Tax=Apatococcus lobatus TaxID=904363 RepID=A0AAW1Q8R8_9CHLO
MHSRRVWESQLVKQLIYCTMCTCPNRGVTVCDLRVVHMFWHWDTVLLEVYTVPGSLWVELGLSASEEFDGVKFFLNKLQMNTHQATTSWRIISGKPGSEVACIIRLQALLAPHDFRLSLSDKDHETWDLLLHYTCNGKNERGTGSSAPGLSSMQIPLNS